MASETTLLRALEMVTVAKLETLGESRAPVRGIRSIIQSKNVVGVGIAEKVSKRGRTGQLALTFYVEKKVSPKKLRGVEMIPPALPEAISGPEAVPTDVVVLGRLKLEKNAIRQPIQPGNSIGHIDITAGTLGALVTNGKERFLLSNSHVLALGGTAKKGDAIVYPGPDDGGKKPKDVIATLEKVQKFTTGGNFVNLVDCAMAKPVPGRIADLRDGIRGLGLPTGVAVAKRGMAVTKVGRTTGRTVGTVRDVNFRFVLDYDKVGSVGFRDQVLCTRYTRGGDSGSLVLESKTKRAIGLHFAGANGGSVFNPIGPVLKALGVTLVTAASPQTRRRRKRGG
jgi:hypothetical protein